MGLALQCKFFGHIINITKALAVREGATTGHRHTLVFECDKCGKPVRPRAAGDKHVAHFVHVKQNPACGYHEPHREY
jgi:hypothetical protein